MVVPTLLLHAMRVEWARERSRGCSGRAQCPASRRGSRPRLPRSAASSMIVCIWVSAPLSSYSTVACTQRGSRGARGLSRSGAAVMIGLPVSKGRQPRAYPLVPSWVTDRACLADRTASCRPCLPARRRVERRGPCYRQAAGHPPGRNPHRAVSSTLTPIVPPLPAFPPPGSPHPRSGCRMPCPHPGASNCASCAAPLRLPCAMNV